MVTVAVIVPVILVKPVGHTSVYTVVVVVTKTLDGQAPQAPDGSAGLDDLVLREVVVFDDGPCQPDQLCTKVLVAGSAGLVVQADQVYPLVVGSLGLDEVVDHACQVFLPELVVGSEGLEEVVLPPTGH